MTEQRPPDDDSSYDVVRCRCGFCDRVEPSQGCRYKLLSKMALGIGLCFSCRRGIHSGTLPDRTVDDG